MRMLEVYKSARIAAIFALCFLYNLIAPPSTAQTTGLVAAYSFNEGTGTTVTDLSGNNLTGTIVGASWSTQGKYGNALSFNGTSNYVDLGNPTALKLTGSMTIEAWIKAAANPPNDGQIVAKSNNASGWQFKTSPDTGPHTFGIAVGSSSSAQTQRYSNTVRSLNTWYHVAGVYDNTARILNIYVNGVLDSGTLLGTVPSAQFNSTVNVNIGRRTGGYYFNGIIDEIRIYNRALSQAEIQTDMNTPLGATGGDTQAPTAPANLSASASSSTQIGLTWTASTDNVGVTGYLLERCQGADVRASHRSPPPPATNSTDTGCTASTSYSYRVRATDAAGNFGALLQRRDQHHPASADTSAPRAPASLRHGPASATQISLSWRRATDNVGVTGYQLERCQGADAPPSRRSPPPPATT